MRQKKEIIETQIAAKEIKVEDDDDMIEDEENDDVGEEEMTGSSFLNNYTGSAGRGGEVG